MRLFACAAGVLVALCGVSLALPALAQPKGGKPRPAPVVVAKVTAVTEAPHVEYTGLIEPATKALLSAEVAGRLDRLLKREGDPVQKGEVVAVLENPTLKNDLAVTLARVAETEAQLRVGEQQQKRTEQLFKKNLISAQQYEDGRLNLAVTRARLQSDKVQVERMQDQLNRMVIRSPLSGQVITSKLEVGQWITPNQPILEIFNFDAYELLVGVPGRLLPSVPRSGQVRVSVPEIGAALHGEILAVVQHVDSATGNFTLRVRVSDAKGLPLSGMLAKVSLPVGKARRQLTVPRDAVVRQGPRTHVVLVTPEGKAQIVPVQVQGNFGDAVIVAGKGLADGAPVVVRGNERLFPGMPVQVTDDLSKSASG